MSRRKKPKKEKTSFVISSPSGFQDGIHVKKDEETGEIKGLPSQWKERGESTEELVAEDDESLPEVLRPKGADQILKDEERRRVEKERREEEERRKAEKQKKLTALSITGPVKVTHKLHVDQDLNWSEQSPDSLKLTHKLGEGAYGCVYKATHVATDQEVAIKTVLVGAEEGEGVNEIKKEIDILKQCRHPNIVSLYGCVQKGKELWIMMDYCSIGSVKDFMKKANRNLSEQQATAVLFYVCKGLQYLHDINIVHYDLKSANILINNQGNVKIADFGVSYKGDKTLKTKGHSVVGTPLFMSPQALNCCDSGSSSDIWSVGVTAIEMIDGNPPYHEEHVMRAMLLIASGPPATVAHPDQYSPEFNAFIARCLQMNDKDRPTAAELLTDPLFEGKDHMQHLKGILAEGTILRQNSAGTEVKDERILAQQERMPEEEKKREEEEKKRRKEEDERRKRKEEEKESEESKAEKAARKKAEKEKKAAFVSKLRLVKSGRVDMDELRRPNSASDRFEKPQAWTNCSESFDASSEQMSAMEGVMKALKRELDAQRLFCKEMEKYEGMTFRQLAQEINEMTVKVSQLQKELRDLTSVRDL